MLSTMTTRETSLDTKNSEEYGDASKMSHVMMILQVYCQRDIEQVEKNKIQTLSSFQWPM